jgi:hypothetical protein
MRRNPPNNDTPKHSSWLDMAESELSVLSCQRLYCRIPDKDKANRGSRRMAETPQQQTHHC